VSVFVTTQLSDASGISDLLRRQKQTLPSLG
jgi:hypothetical protein